MRALFKHGGALSASEAGKPCRCRRGSQPRLHGPCRRVRPFNGYVDGPTTYVGAVSADDARTYAGVLHTGSPE